MKAFQATQIIAKWGLVCLIFSLISTVPAGAATPQWDIGFEDDLSRHVVEPQNFLIISAGGRLDTEDSQADLHFKISPNHPKAFTFSSQNFYYGGRNETRSETAGDFHWSVGRRRFNFSKIDENWQTGNIEPLDSWDRLRSFTQGLTGLFVEKTWGAFQFRAFGSYLALPELSPNVVLEGDQFQNEHPQGITTAPQSFTLLSRETPLGYHLNIPAISKIIFRPSVLFSAEAHALSHWSAKAVAGYLPLNYFPIALKASLAIPVDQIVVQLTPRLLSHAVYSGELSFRQDQFEVGISGLIDRPESESLPSDYTATPLTASYSVSPWITFSTRTLEVLLSQLVTTKGLDPDVGPYANPSSSVFSSRMLYRNASLVSVKVGLADSSAWKPSLFAKYVHEYSVQGDWIAADFSWAFNPHFLGFVGGDLIAAEKDASADRGAEFLGDMRALDRVRFGVNYAF